MIGSTASTLAAFTSAARTSGRVSGSAATITRPDLAVSSAQLRAETMIRIATGGPTGMESMPPVPPEILQAGLGGALIPAIVAGVTKVAPRVLPWVQKAILPVSAGIVGYGLSEAGEAEPGGIPGTAIPVQEGFLPWQRDIIPDEWVAYSWNTGTAVFYRLIDGRIAVQNKMGVWKVYRPKKHIVISTNPRMSQLNKLFRTCDKVTKRLARTKYLKRQ